MEAVQHKLLLTVHSLTLSERATQNASLPAQSVCKHAMWPCAGMTEAELIAALTSVKGIGPWTADMFMMFSAGRPDVLPVGDLGVRKGFQILFSLKVSCRRLLLLSLLIPDNCSDGKCGTSTPMRPVACEYHALDVRAGAARRRKDGGARGKLAAVAQHRQLVHVAAHGGGENEVAEEIEGSEEGGGGSRGACQCISAAIPPSVNCLIAIADYPLLVLTTHSFF